MLTSKEVQALDAILDVALIKSKEEDDGEPVFHEIEVEGNVNPFPDKSTLDGVYDISGHLVMMMLESN